MIFAKMQANCKNADAKNIFAPPWRKLPSYATGNMTSLNGTSFSPSPKFFSGGATASALLAPAWLRPWYMINCLDNIR